MAELHRGAALEKHGPPAVDLEHQILGLLRDPAAPLDRRVRRVASIGAIAGVLLAANAFAEVPDADLEIALRGVIHDVLQDRPNWWLQGSGSALPLPCTCVEAIARRRALVTDMP